MADWADILGQALAGGGMAYTGSRADSIAQEEARAEEEALMNLKRQYQIEDRMWDQRMADVQWGRQVAENEKSRQHQRDMAKDQQASQNEYKQWAMDFEENRRRYNEEEAPTDLDKKVKSLKGLLESGDITEKQYNSALDGLLTTGKEYQTRPQDTFNAINTAKELYHNYLATLRSGDDKPTFNEFLDMEEHVPAKLRNAVKGMVSSGGKNEPADTSVDPSGIYGTVTDLIDKQDEEGLKAFRKSIENDPEALAQYNRIGSNYLKAKKETKSQRNMKAASSH